MVNRTEIGFILLVQVDVVVLGIPRSHCLVADFGQGSAAGDGVHSAGEAAYAVSGCVAEQVSGQRAVDDAGGGCHCVELHDVGLDDGLSSDSGKYMGL